MARTDILIDENDLIIQDNDLSFGDSDYQHVEDTIQANVGFWKENPQDGVGIKSYLKNTVDTSELSRKIQVQLLSDGYTSTPIINFTSNGLLTINPNVSL